jgi:hypothetical protein
VLNRQQGADGGDFQPELPRAVDEDKPAEVADNITPPVAFHARRGWQQADFFEIADGLHLHAAAGGGDAGRDTGSRHFFSII